MHTGQSAIFLDIPSRSRYLTFVIKNQAELKNVLTSLSHMVDGTSVMMGIGIKVATTMQKEVPGLHLFPDLSKAPAPMSATPGDLWFWLRGDDLGKLLHRGRAIEVIANPAFELVNVVDGFKYGDGMDLTGYQDGTENPKGELAQQAALMSDESVKMDGSSFVAVQQWLHDLNHFEGLEAQQQDHIIGRSKATNEEIADAPKSAHVKRVEQDDFDPPAYVVRRSIPWIENQQSGLMFVAFGHSFDAFEVLLRRMVGLDDGVTDALFAFTKPLTANYYWCPPIGKEGLDLAQLMS
jgi:putative iron-dependent peroxidase